MKSNKESKKAKREIVNISMSYVSQYQYVIVIDRKTNRMKKAKSRTYTVSSLRHFIISKFTMAQWSPRVVTIVHFGVYPSITMTPKEI